MSKQRKEIMKNIIANKLFFLVISLGIFFFNSNYPLKAQSSEDLFKEFDQWVAEKSKQHDQFAAQEEKAYQNFVEATHKQWNDYVNSTQTEWVAYSNNLLTRSRVDFEKGNIKLETLIPIKNNKSYKQPQIRKIEYDPYHSSPQFQIIKSIYRKSPNRFKQPYYPLGDSPVLIQELQDKPAPTNKFRTQATTNFKNQIIRLLSNDNPSGKILIQGQLQTSEGTALTKENLDEFAQDEILKKSQIQESPARDKDGNLYIKVVVQLEMVPDHLQSRVVVYKPFVDQYSKRFGVKKQLIYAIIHTESHFNPLARSHIPAYGLMQLVPRSGGRDAYRFVHKKDATPPPSLLYKPESNIELGVGYISKLRKYEFRRVKNELNAEYLIIASYNTGAGNVSKGLLGKISLRKLAKYVNKLQPEQLFNELQQKLHHKEARDYLKRVTSRQQFYDQL